MKKSFFITGTLIGLIIAFQNNAKVLVPFDDKLEQEKDFKEIISIIDSEKKDLQVEYSNLSEKIGSISSKNANIDQSKFNEMQLKLGVNEMQGPGVEITIKGDVAASDLRDLVNVIREIGVEGIAIGKQRIIYNTPIIDLKTAILVGNTRMKSPIAISIIGDGKRIIFGISENPILKNFLKKNNSRDIEVEIVEKDIFLPRT